MRKIRVLAVEDDELHADVLRMVLDQLDYELINIASTSGEVMSLLKATKPDVLLMDIDLNGEESGIDLVRKINSLTDIPVIYLTSFKDDAVFRQARETMPEAYLTKPYEAENLRAAIELAVLKKQKEINSLLKTVESSAPASTVFVKEGNTLVKVKLQEIALVEAYDKYCFIYIKEKKHLLNLQFKSLCEHLPSDQFIQVHRSYIVNLEAIEKVRLPQNDLEVAGKIVPVSKTYRNLLFSQLKML
ncbi:LytTR family DNA-binding domain-containing protein [Telluribacter sp. SYSU D00476]|uniref:LytR/AlgR family response regulator transcription factor n=1 Tax=Telluribacter sp. SYSU D00476 TaxID=2811430 RepID=UPI001FF3762D|nr:response regulator [Telluribacter sp. SYSU D00476]